MCRFAAFIGKKKILLKSVLEEPSNSLIHQSKSAKEGKTGINGDGFGIGWYNHDVDNFPAVFKSVLPAWNDENLINISSKITSKCFLGHVRSSTVGSVALTNCHPFKYKQLLFMHNGTINQFNKVKKNIIEKISDELLENIKGQTDSEYIFALFCTILGKSINKLTISKLSSAIKETFSELENIQKNSFSRLNILVTDGKIMIATRYSTKKKEKPLSLHYSSLFMNSEKGFFISSEELNEISKQWRTVPENHYVAVEKNHDFSIEKI